MLGAARALLIVALVVSASPARAGNEDTVPLSNEAAIEGGAVTATITGGGASYANPAGLARIGTDRLDVTATTYILRLAALPAIGEGGPGVPVTATKLTTLDLTSVPSSLAYVRRMSARVAVGFGVFVPSVLDRNLTSAVKTQPRAGAADVELGTDLRIKSSTYFVGPSIGVQVTPTLCLGAGLFATYERLHQSFSLLVTQRANDQLGYFAMGTDVKDVVSVGGQLVLAAQWQPTRNLRAGLAFRSPRQQVFAIKQHMLMSGGADLSQAVAPDAKIEPSEKTGASWAMLAPARVDAGVAWEDEGWRVSLDGTFIAGHPGNDEVAPRRPTLNVRAGTRLLLTRALSLGAGVFTDRSQTRVSTATDIDANFYGVSVGAELGTFYLATPSPPPSGGEPQPSSLAFKTAIALRYAVGVGQAGGLALTPGGSALFTAYAQDILLHEIGLHLGSSLLF